MLVRGGDSVFVTPDDLAAMTLRMPALQVEAVPGAGHAVQSDQPLALAALISSSCPAGEHHGCHRRGTRARRRHQDFSSTEDVHPEV